MDSKKHIAYWRDGAEEDFAVAGELLEHGRLRYALFFAHLAVEKILKAHVVKVTDALPPRIHNLVRLCEIAGLTPSDTQMDVMNDLNMYQIEGRYPGRNLPPLDEQTAHDDFSKAAELIEWLSKAL